MLKGQSKKHPISSHIKRYFTFLLYCNCLQPYEVPHSRKNAYFYHSRYVLFSPVGRKDNQTYKHYTTRIYDSSSMCCTTKYGPTWATGRGVGAGAIWSNLSPCSQQTDFISLLWAWHLEIILYISVLTVRTANFYLFVVQLAFEQGHENLLVQ